MPEPNARTADRFEQYLADVDIAAGGFQVPVGDGRGGGSYVDRATGKRHKGWYVATVFAESYDLGVHTGEDWNGKGGGDTDLGQPVLATARGRVTFARRCEDPWGGVVMVDHVYYVNHERHVVRSQYAHLSRIDVQAGQVIERGRVIGAIGKDPGGRYPAHLHFELRTDLTLEATYWPSSNDRSAAWVREHYADPRRFIHAHRQLFVPSNEDGLILVDATNYRMRHHGKGKRPRDYEVAFGQAKGRKRKRGDDRTPRGMYFVTDKHRGEFSGEYAQYYGGHWIKVNYPNAFDAAWGAEHGLIGKKVARRIRTRWKEKRLTPQKTQLGSGIGFHGWAGPWSLAKEGGHLSWGCIVMHNEDITALYDHVGVGTMVVVF